MKRITTPDERFHDGNKADGTLGTLVIAEWLNNVQEELAGVIEGQQLPLDGAKQNQLAEAIAKVVATHAQGRGHPAATEAAQGMVRYATTAEHLAGEHADRSTHPAGVKAAIEKAILAARSGDQFATYDAARTYTTGETARGSDGKFYEFYDRDQVGTVTGVDPTDPLNRPHVWMEWYGVRPGTVIEWRSETLPEGYIENDGAAVSRSAYRRIFAAFGTTHGAGDGSITFGLPDDRGEFKRGWDHGRGIDSGRIFASHQWHAVETHNHGVPTGQGELSDNGFWGIDDSYWTEYSQLNIALTANNEPALTSHRGQDRLDQIGGNWAAETRPRNNAVIYMTKI